jgi:SAM-dependent methyltransferase
VLSDQRPADLAGQRYWDQKWSEALSLEAIDPHRDDLHNFANQSIHTFLVTALQGMATDGKSLVEVGCARSGWLPYFAKEYGFDLNGLDYSPVGCEQARAILANAGIEARIFQGDLFQPPHELVRSQDVVVTFGVVEHFADTVASIRALSRLMAPSGVLITIIPNLTGLLGRIQHRLDPRIFNLHVPMTLGQLELVHREAGLSPFLSRYVMGSNWGVLNLGSWAKGRRRASVERLISWSTHLSWLVERRAAGRWKPNQWLSPYVAVAARFQSDSSLRVAD